MNCLLAKVKIKKEVGFKKLLSGEQVYRKPDDLNGAIKYDCARVLDDDEWFLLADFSDKNFCIDLLKNKFRSTDYTSVNSANAEIIEFICSYQNEEYFFQRIFKHSILTQRRISLGDNIKLEDAKRSIILNDVPDAIYIKKEDKLYFKKLQTIAPIFHGIDILFKEATREETAKFLQNDFIKPIDGYNVDKVKNMNRKRIAMAMETLNGFNKKQKKTVLDYTHTYYPQLQYKDGKFSVKSEDDLKYLLWGIEQRYYTTPVTGEKRVANSVINL